MERAVSCRVECITPLQLALSRVAHTIRGRRLQHLSRQVVVFEKLATSVGQPTIFRDRSYPVDATARGMAALGKVQRAARAN